MPARPLLAHPAIIFTAALLLAIPFPARDAGAGTAWREGAPGFASGTMDNVSLESGSLVLGLDEAPREGWKDKNAATPPTARAHHSMAYDSAAGVTVLFGGWLGNCTLGDTWVYNSTTNKWTNVTTPSAPPARGFHCLVYDTGRGEMIMFGGWSGTGFLNDTWTYNASQNEWTLMSPSAPPPARQQYAMAYDGGQDEAVLFGGKNGTESFGDTWAYDPGTDRWTEKHPPQAPAPRVCSAMGYDGQNGVSVLFGGADIDYLGDTWTYDLGQNRWTDMSPAGPPPARESHALAYDSVRRKEVLFGGHNVVHLQDTWSYDACANRWTNATSSGGPSPRDGITLAYDDRRGEMMMFGGYDGWGLHKDTWAYDAKMYRPAGNFTSAPHDTGGAAYFGALCWDADIPLLTSLAFQFRSADTLDDLSAKDLSGPDGSVNTYYEAGGLGIDAACNGSRWFQYRAVFGTADRSTTPALRGVEVRYNLIHNLSMLSPAGGENWTGVRTISWSATDPDGDGLRFDLFLLHSTGRAITLAEDLTARQWQWDTAGIANGTYRIRVVARDDNASIPLSVEAVSGDFTVRSPSPPPPNRPPHVTLLSPGNNSHAPTGTVRLQWLGTDPEGDALVYTVSRLDRPFGTGEPLRDITTAECLDLTGLADDLTCYWTVDASDGTNDHADVPAPVWSFTVALAHPPLNHPPGLAPVPPFTINVGEAFTHVLFAADEDLDPLAFSLVLAPPAMTVDPKTGRLRWTPAAPDIGNHTVTARVSDGRGGADERTFTITVVETPARPPIPPACNITFPADGSTVAGRFIVRGTAANGSLPLTLVQVRIDNGTWQAAAGLDHWTILIDTAKSAGGRHTLEARSFDGSLYSETASIGLESSAPGRTTSVEGPPWCPALIIVIAAAALAGYLIMRRRGRS